MTNRRSFSSHTVTLRRFTIGCGLVFIIALAIFKASTPRSHAASQRQLTFEDRVAA
ncbi:MAG: hypothetical protein ACREEM_43175 [Blastocatellia bacterium]